MADVMIDLETLSTRADSVILILAAIRFSRDANEIKMVDIPEKDKFYRRINIKSCTDVGLRSDPKTLAWWNTQDKAIRDEALSNGDDRVNLKTALLDFSKWFGNTTYIWSHGLTFDVPILDEAYRHCDLEVPWKFYNARDTRTVFELSGVNIWDLPKDNMHHALYDCHRQILGVKRALKILKKN